MLCSEYIVVQFVQVKLTKVSYKGTLFNVWFIQDLILFRVLLNVGTNYHACDSRPGLGHIQGGSQGSILNFHILVQCKYVVSFKL